MNRTIVSSSVMLMLLCCGLTGCTCNDRVTRRPVPGTDRYALLRVEQPPDGAPFFALGRVGSFYYHATPGIPDEFFTAMHQMHLSVQPQPAPASMPATRPDVPEQPHVEVQGGPVYVVGSNPVATTDSIAAGAEGCELLLLQSGQDWYIYVIADAADKSVNGNVFARNGHGSASQSHIGHKMFVRVYPKNANEVGIDPPKPFNPDSIPELIALRKEFLKRTKP